MTQEFRILFEAQLEKSEVTKLKKNENYSGPKKSNLKKSKSQDFSSSQTFSFDSDTKSEASKNVRYVILLRGFGMFFLIVLFSQ